MRSAFAAALLALSMPGVPSAYAQSLAPTRPAIAPGEPNRGTLPGRPADPGLEAERLQSETRLKRRENEAKRTLRSICRGC